MYVESTEELPRMMLEDREIMISVGSKDRAGGTSDGLDGYRCWETGEER